MMILKVTMIKRLQIFVKKKKSLTWSMSEDEQFNDDDDFGSFEMRLT